MVSIKVFLTRELIRKQIGHILEGLSRAHGKDAIHYYFCTDGVRFRNHEEEIDAIIVGLFDQKDLQFMKEIRRKYPHAALLVISGRDYPMEQCVIPEIRPLLLLKEPLEKKRTFREICRLYRYVLDTKDRANGRGFFAFHQGSLRRWLPYSEIIYFEARNKKIFLCSGRGDFEFYDSFANMRDDLPDQFVRCHRGYMVNTAYLSEIDFARQVMLLGDDYEIPISKKYRKQLEKVRP